MTTDYSQSPVAFSSGDNELAGTLVLPLSQGPHPVAVFIHGSGKADRTAAGMYLAVFEEFARCGIASLSWDKPGVGESTGHFFDQSFEDRAAEAIAAIDSLAGRADIDISKIGLWGISQAGWVMPLVCEQRPETAFMIGVSVPASTVRDQDLFRIRNSLPASGFSAEHTDEALEFMNRLHQLAIEDAAYDDALEQLQGYADRPWAPVAFGGTPDPAGFEFLKRIILVDPKPVIRSIKCPVMLVFGEKDTLVDTGETSEAYEQLLMESGNSDLTIHRFPDADHVLTRTETGGQVEIVGKINGDEWQHVPGYVESMGEWLEERVRR